MNEAKRLPVKLMSGLGLTITVAGALTYFAQETLIMSRLDTRAPGMYLCLAGVGVSTLAVIGRQPIENLRRPRIDLAALAISVVATGLYGIGTYGSIREITVRFTNGEVTLSGTLLTPRSQGPHPAVVMMHGAGPSLRMDNFIEARSLTRAGLAVLIYDKRGTGRSLGGDPRLDGYHALADDAVAAVEMLRRRPEIDSRRIGLWGTSEGGWTAPMAASAIEDLAFMIIVSGGPITPERQGAYEIEQRLIRTGHQDAGNDALRLYDDVNSAIRDGHFDAELVADLDQARNEEWYDLAEIEPDHEQWWKSHLDTDVAPLLQKLDAPLLFVLGEDDPVVPATVIEREIEALRRQPGDHDITVLTLPGATHNLISAPTRCRVCIDDPLLGPIQPWFVSGYLDSVNEWVLDQLDSTAP